MRNKLQIWKTEMKSPEMCCIGLGEIRGFRIINHFTVLLHSPLFLFPSPLPPSHCLYLLPSLLISILTLLLITIPHFLITNYIF
jgi:hypothetical protein